MIISNILVEFGDGVLWFVKVLIILYCMFYIFSIIRQTNRTVGLIFLCVSTIVLTVLTGSWLASFSAISVPFFTIGVVLSLFKEQKHGVFIPILSLIIISLSYFVLLDRALAIHGFLNAMFLVFLIFLFCYRRVDIKIPVVFGIISFDLYLVHNKVLMSLKNYMDVVPLSIFILTTLALTFLFYLFRSKLLKIW